MMVSRRSFLFLKGFLFTFHVRFRGVISLCVQFEPQKPSQRSWSASNLTKKHGFVTNRKVLEAVFFPVTFATKRSKWHMELVVLIDRKSPVTCARVQGPFHRKSWVQSLTKIRYGVNPFRGSFFRQVSFPMTHPMGRRVHLPIHLLTWMVDLYGKCREMCTSPMDASWDWKVVCCFYGCWADSACSWFWLMPQSLERSLCWIPLPKKHQFPAQSFYCHKIIPRKTSRLPC